MSKEIDIIEILSPYELKAYKKELRKHSKPKLRMLGSSIKEYGFIIPIVVDEKNTIVAGHARWLAAKELGLEKVPLVRVSHLSPAQIRAYRIADNKMAEGSKWDGDVLRVELSEIILEVPEIQIEALGLEPPGLEILMDGGKKEQIKEPEQVKANNDFAVTEDGMLWQLVDHYLICGDARNSACFIKVLRGEKAHIIFGDPPYNVKIQGFVGGKGSIKHREFACAVGEMNDAEFTEFLQIIFQNLADFSLDGSVHYLCMDWRHIQNIMDAGGRVYDELLNLIVWCKSNAGLGSLYRSQHELIFAYKNGTAKHINNIQLGRFGRNRTNVWQYDGVNSINSEHRKDLKLHPTVKPTAMIADALKDCSNKGDIVLDAPLAAPAAPSWQLSRQAAVPG